MSKPVMQLRTEITDDWVRVINELRFADQKLWYQFRGRSLRPARALAERAAAAVPRAPLSGTKPASPQGYARLLRPGRPERKRALVSVGVRRLGWTQAADLVQRPGQFREAVESRWGPAQTSRWWMPAIDAGMPALMVELRVAMERAARDLGVRINGGRG